MGNVTNVLPTISYYFERLQYNVFLQNKKLFFAIQRRVRMRSDTGDRQCFLLTATELIQSNKY